MDAFESQASLMSEAEAEAAYDRAVLRYYLPVESQSQYIRASTQKEPRNPLLRFTSIDEDAGIPEPEVEEEDGGNHDDALKPSPSSAKLRAHEEILIREASVRWRADRLLNHQQHRDSKGLDPLLASKRVRFRRFNMDSDGLDDDSDLSPEISKVIIRALKLRQKYMQMSMQAFPDFLAPFLQKVPPHPEAMLSHHAMSSASLPDLSDMNHAASMHSSTTISSSKTLQEDSVNCFIGMIDGVINVFHNSNPKAPLLKYIDVKSWLRDTKMLIAMAADGPLKSFAYHRLKFLQSKFNMHNLLNGDDERTEQKIVPHRDFYNVRKVDTHVHLSSCMTQKHLLHFIKHKLATFPDEVVLLREGKEMTLKQVFDMLKITAFDLSVDSLDVHADCNTFNRFDKFNLKYNPVGESYLREIFMKTDNYMGGRYFAELVREVIADLEQSKNDMAEYRVSIYGRARDELPKLAHWFVSHRMESCNVIWLIQVPRLFYVYAAQDQVKTFAEFLDNIFKPLFEASLFPEKFPEMNEFLSHVCGFDSVDDESKLERYPHNVSSFLPEKWTKGENPPYAYYMYYMYANITTLNQVRKAKGLNTFVLRPHAGEAGSYDHLIATFLSAESIAHGINLQKTPVVQYLYYLCQVGIAISPLSNNSLFLDYTKSPFPLFFQCGMNLSLSTDDPLQFHYTRDPLLEEYSVAAQVWKLSTCDMCELAVNSVKQSGFPLAMKKMMLSEDFMTPGPAGNDILKTNVSNIRVAYRFETLLSELKLCYEPSFEEE